MITAERVLEKLSELPPENGGRQALVFTDVASGVGVKLELERLEALAAQVWEVEATPAAPPRQPLKDRAAAIAARATGLLEPLRLLEVDANLGRALLRSNAPAGKADDRFYYEGLVDTSGRAVLRRYQGSTAVGQRQQVSFTLTREALAKLVSDLAG